MRVYRVCRAPYAALDGEGARRTGGRWNSLGTAVVYAAEHPARAVLEILVHSDTPADLFPDDYVVARLNVPDDAILTEDANLSSDTAALGDAWVRRGLSLALSVRSAVAPLSRNVLLNPAHPRMSDVRAETPIPWSPDPRLLRARIA